MTLNRKTMTLIYQKNKITLLLVGFFCFVSSIHFVNAQGALSLSVSPAIFEMNANPDQTWESKLRIINNNPFELTVYAEAVDFRPSGEDGSARFIPVESEDQDLTSLGEWITVPETALVIGPEQTLEIPIRIELPEDAPPGGHYAAILVGTRPPDNRSDSTRVETSQVVSSLIFLRVSGNIVEEGNIRGFRAIDGLVEKPEVDFELRFENTGNVHLRPEGEIRIFNMWGQERGVIPVNQRTLFGNILSESIRSFRFTWEGEWSPVDIGLYRAEATLAYGEDARNFTSAEARFWIIPWRILTGILLVLLTIILLLTWLVKLYVRRMFALAGLQESNPLQKQLIQKKHREVSVVAPIEAGILDLRSRFNEAGSSKLDTLFKYLYEYKTFFVGLLIVAISIYIVSWFFVSVSENDRAFEVTINGSGGNVVVDSESLEYEQHQTFKVVEKRDIPPVLIVNRSGVNGAAANAALVLEEFGYTIKSVSTDLNTIEEQTVIVFDPSLEDQALELSTILDNALLSAFTVEDPDMPLITIYVGSDLSNF